MRWSCRSSRSSPSRPSVWPMMAPMMSLRWTVPFTLISARISYFMALPFPPPPRPDLPPERFELFLPMWFLSLFAHNHRALVRQRVLSGPKHPTCRAGEVNVNISPTCRALLNAVQNFCRPWAIFTFNGFFKKWKRVGEPCRRLNSVRWMCFVQRWRSCWLTAS